VIAAAAATATLTVAGEAAAARARGPGGFAVALLDELALIEPTELANRVKIG
jgi:hydroxyethylthiazole kinase